MNNVKIVSLPSKVSIWAGNAGEIVLGVGEMGDPQCVVTNLTYGGSFLGNGQCSITVWEPAGAVVDASHSGGVWRIRVNDADCFYGFPDTSSAQRINGGYMRTWQLVDLLTAWDLTLNNVIPTGHTTEAPSTTFTLSDALSWMILGDGTDDYPGVADRTMSNIPFTGFIPTTSILVRDQYSDKVLVMPNSTYLAEIQKLAQVMGVTVYQNPAQKAITCAYALTPGLGDISSMESNRYKEATFDVSYGTIPASVLVMDDVTHKASSYGKYGGTADPQNFTMTGRNNLAYISTIGVDDSKLTAYAKTVFDVSRKASQVLTFIYAGLEPDKAMLGKTFSWIDSEGRKGAYSVSSFTVNLTSSSVYTTIEAYIV